MDKNLTNSQVDVYKDYLHITTTTAYWPNPDVHNTMSIVKEKPGELMIIGQIDNIAPKEDKGVMLINP